ncbi:MAG: carboxymuconolactone decarboxylase family protein [Paracoccaceae bacterium]|nr:carboxymuconolactone decarboxylase family protein [Paracoccaceae bacterium]
MTVSYVERDQADAETTAFYDKAEDRFKALLNIFKVFGHVPEYGNVFTETIMAILKDGELDWLTKELLILKATQRNDCQYCVVQHERLCDMLGMPADKVADLDGDKYKTSPHFTEGERALLDFCLQIGVDANRVPKGLWDRLHAHWTEAQIVDAAFVITTYIAVSKFGDALGVELEPMFDGVKPVLTISH